MTPEILEKISQLEKMVNALEDLNDRERAQRKAAERARNAETLRVRELEEAFVRYAWHDKNCDKPFCDDERGVPLACSCGFDTALKKVVE